MILEDDLKFKTEVLHRNVIHLTVPVVGLVARVLFWASRGYCSSKPVSGWEHLIVLNLVFSEIICLRENFFLLYFFIEILDSKWEERSVFGVFPISVLEEKKLPESTSVAASDVLCQQHNSELG